MPDARQLYLRHLGHFDVPGIGRLDVTGSGTVEAFVTPARGTAP